MFYDTFIIAFANFTVQFFTSFFLFYVYCRMISKRNKATLFIFVRFRFNCQVKILFKY